MVKDNNFSLENCTGHPASFGENDVNFTERLISDIENNKRIIVRKCQAETSASDHFKYFPLPTKGCPFMRRNLKVVGIKYSTANKKGKKIAKRR